MNLIMNAIKFTISGRVEVRFHFGERLTCQVEDTGVGIGEQD